MRSPVPGGDGGSGEEAVIATDDEDGDSLNVIQTSVKIWNFSP